MTDEERFDYPDAAVVIDFGDAPYLPTSESPSGLSRKEIRRIAETVVQRVIDTPSYIQPLSEAEEVEFRAAIDLAKRENKAAASRKKAI